MAEITPEMTHALLEKLAAYVMNEVPTRQEIVTKEEFEIRFSNLEKRQTIFERGLATLEKRQATFEDRMASLEEKFNFVIEILNQKADKYELAKLQKDVDDLKKSHELLLNGLDRVANELVIIRTEQKAFMAALERLEQRVETLEFRVLGYRVRDTEQ